MVSTVISLLDCWLWFQKWLHRGSTSELEMFGSG